MILKKDNFIFGFILGLIAPVAGLIIYKYTKFQVFSFRETFQYIIYQPGHSLLTGAITLSLLANAILFTIFINFNIDKTAKGIFAATMLYAIVALSLKFFG